MTTKLNNPSQGLNMHQNAQMLADKYFDKQLDAEFPIFPDRYTDRVWLKTSQ